MIILRYPKPGKLLPDLPHSARNRSLALAEAKREKITYASTIMIRVTVAQNLPGLPRSQIDSANIVQLELGSGAGSS